MCVSLFPKVTKQNFDKIVSSRVAHIFQKVHYFKSREI